jgi:hypothetical protein
LDDPESQINVLAMANRSRARHALEEMGTLPRITYLAGGV